MTSQKNKIKEATSFFGVERMDQLESAIKEQSQRTMATQKSSQVIWHIKMLGAITLMVYSISATAFIVNNEINSENTPPEIIASSQNEITPIKINNDPAIKINAPKPETKITVKKGDSLSTIAQRIIKSNGLKNSHENRQIVISELKSKNTNLQANQPIKFGWTLLSLSKNEAQQICKN